MNHYSASQRESDKRWDYTSSNRRTGTFPVGYCGGWKEWTPEERAQYYMSDTEWARIKAHQSKYHSNGHATAGEARACYRQYLLDNRMRLDGTYSNTQRQCAVCSEWTQCYAIVGDSTHFDLCDSHRTVAEVEKLMPEIGESWSSY